MTTDTKPDLKVVTPKTVDPFDNLAALRVSQDFYEATPVEKLLTTVPVHKPDAQDFIRVHSGLDYRETLALLELKDDRETFVVDLNTIPDLRGEVFVATVFTAITRVGVVFLWPVRVPVDGRSSDWHTSAAAAAAHAMFDGCGSNPT